MRVCVVAEYYPRPEDPVLGIWAHRQALAARSAGAEVRVLALARPLPSAASVRSALRGRPQGLKQATRTHLSLPRHTRRDGIEIEYVRFLAPPRERSYAAWQRYARRPLARALDQLDRRWGIDVIHAHYAVPAGAAARPWAAVNAKPLVVSVHGGDVLAPTLSAPPARAVIGQVLRAAEGVLCNSGATLRIAAALAGSAEHMRVVHLGAEAYPPLAKQTHPTLVTLAHVVGRKRHADVLEAIALLRERLPGLRWVVIGTGPGLDRLRARTAELGLSDRVSFTGQLDPPRALAALARCHLMVMPSVDEAFGVAYIEALACGVPAVGLRGEGGPEEIAALGGGMLLAPPNDPRGLAGVIEGALEKLEELTGAARSTAAKHFSWTACGEATVSAYRAALR